MPPKHRAQVVLIGDPALRPDGLERALVRAGYQVTDVPFPAPGETIGVETAPDFVILSAGVPDAATVGTQVRRVVGEAALGGAPVLALVGAGGTHSITEALRGGARDAAAGPVSLEELLARLELHARLRGELVEARAALQSRDLLFDIFQEVSAALRADEIFQTLVRRVGQAFGLAHCSFVLTAAGEDKGRVVAVFENPAVRDLRVELERYPEILEAIRTERPVVIHDVHEHPLFENIRHRWSSQQLDVTVQAAVALPVFVQGRAAGVFFLRTEKGDPELRPEHVAFANTIAQAAARVLENEERRSAIYRRQISAGATDPLTGCASLDALDRRVRDEFERARRYALRFALVLVDIDRLRDVNDRFGQSAGDRLLADFGRVLQREIRAPDFVARYGGDEFACILPETDGPGGRQFVERLRQVLSRHTFADLGPGREPSISAGIAAFPHTDVLRPEDLFTLAENALQKGKTGEPDRIGLATQLGG